MKRIDKEFATRKNEAKWATDKNGKGYWRLRVTRDSKTKEFAVYEAGKKGKIACEQKADAWLKGEAVEKVKEYRFWELYEKMLEDTKELKGVVYYKQLEHLGRLHLKPRLEHKKVETLTVQDWQDCITAAFKKGVSEKTKSTGLSKKSLKNLRGAMTAFCTYCKRSNIKVDRPEDLVIPKKATVKEKRVLQPEQIKTLFTDATTLYDGEVADDFYIHAFRYIVLSGVRRGELCGMLTKHQTDDVNRITQSVNNLLIVTEGKTKNARRAFYTTDTMKKVLADQKAMLKARGIVSPYLFPSPDGEMANPNRLYKRWVMYCKHHGFECNLHELRHTMISVCKEVPEQLLKKVVGHSEAMDTFGQYGHYIDGDLQRAANMIGEAFGRFLGGVAEG